MDVKLVQGVARTGRKLRSPRHTFNIRHKPMCIVPFLIAPVLAGDTMKKLSFQSRCVSAPVKSALVGWFLEHYFFYVKHRDLDMADTLVNMHTDATASVATAKRAATSAKYYTTAGGMDFVEQCHRRVVTDWFRDEDHAWNLFMIDGYPAAYADRPGWLDSYRTIAEGAEPKDDLLPGDPTVAPYGLPVGMQGHYDQWLNMVSLKLTTKSFDDFLRSAGVQQPEVVETMKRTELLRYERNWSYPSNTVDPLTGTPTSALSWSVSETADKDRFFDEPGFVYGVSVARPKFYYSGQKGAAVELLNDAFRWLPPAAMDELHTHLGKLAAGDLTVGASAAGEHWIDVGDLFRLGDQFVNHDILADGKANDTALPAGQYCEVPYEADVDDLFVGADKTVRQDGIAQLYILSRLGKDMTG